jgi:branched-chain amino acid transport system ATP-binding protein
MYTLSLHDALPILMHLSNRVYVLNQGELIAEGLPDEVMNNPDVIRSYIGEKRYAS